MERLMPLEYRLYQAILVNDLDEVSLLLTQGANPNKTLGHGKTCLSEAAIMGNTSVVKLLIDHSKVTPTDKVHSQETPPFKRQMRTYKRKIKESEHSETVAKCKTLGDTYHVDCGKVCPSIENKTQKNQGYFVLIHSEGSSSDESRVPSLNSPVSPPCLTPSPPQELEWDEDIGDAATPTSEDETWSSMYKWYASILETTGAAIASASAVTCGIDQQDAFMKTALHYAAEQGHSDVVKLLIQAGCKLDSTACDGLTPLHVAVLRENTDIVQLLVSSGSQVNSKNHKRVTPLHLAASRGCLDLVMILVKSGANLEAHDLNDRTALYTAALEGHEEVIRYLISAGADVNIEEIHGYTPLCQAVWQGERGVVEMLLKAGARITHSHKLLHSAIVQHQKEIVKLLVSVGACSGINLHNESGDTPLLLAARRVMLDIARILLDNGANVNACNSITGENALHIAVECAERPEEFEDLLLCFIEHGIDLDATALTGDTALNRALLLQQDHIAVLLIRYGADVNTCDVRTCMCGLDNLAIAGRRTTNHVASILLKAGHCMPVPDPSPVPARLQACAVVWLQDALRQPLSLMDLSRIIVRQVRKKRVPITRFVQSLPLPASLKSFIMMDDECALFKQCNV